MDFITVIVLMAAGVAFGLLVDRVIRKLEK